MTDVEILGGSPRFSIEHISDVVAGACARAGARCAILYGSYARGTADAFSDVDLLIVHETSRPFLERFRDFIGLLDALPGTELLVYTPLELEAMRRRGGLVGRAIEEGLILYGSLHQAGDPGQP